MKSASLLLQFLLLLSSLWIAWVILSYCNFGYPIWFDFLQMKSFINELGPKNHYREGFAQLDRADYIYLFSQINHAVHFHANELKNIAYTFINAQGNQDSIKLLRAPEIQHLQDVSALIKKIYAVGIMSCFLFICTLVKVFSPKFTEYDQVKYASLIWLIMGVIIIAIIAFDPTEIFYWFHHQIFPAGHQWFFYYEESLMTTLMKAPDLFGAIAALLIATALTLHFTISAILNYAADILFINTSSKSKSQA